MNNSEEVTSEIALNLLHLHKARYFLFIHFTYTYLTNILVYIVDVLTTMHYVLSLVDITGVYMLISLSYNVTVNHLVIFITYLLSNLATYFLVIRCVFICFFHCLIVV